MHVPICDNCKHGEGNNHAKCEKLNPENNTNYFCVNCPEKNGGDNLIGWVHDGVPYGIVGCHCGCPYNLSGLGAYSAPVTFITPTETEVLPKVTDNDPDEEPGDEPKETLSAPPVEGPAEGTPEEDPGAPGRRGRPTEGHTERHRGARHEHEEENPEE